MIGNTKHDGNIALNFLQVNAERNALSFLEKQRLART